jgi:hypothetical protein
MLSQYPNKHLGAKMEKIDLKLDIDMADFHGIKVNENFNPYDPPTLSSSSLPPNEFVKLGFWSYLSIFLLVSWFIFIGYTLITIAVTSGENVSLFVVFLIALVCLLCLCNILVLFKVELARKIAVAHAFLLLLGIPIGTIIGVILLKNLRGKKFSKT